MKILEVSTGHHHVNCEDGTTMVIAKGDATIRCLNGEKQLTVLLFDSACCYSRENCHVIAQDNSKVYAHGGAVEAFKETTVDAHLDTEIVARGISSVTAHDVCTGHIFEWADLKASGACKFVVMSNGQVELQDRAEVDYAPLSKGTSLKFCGGDFEVLAQKLIGLAENIPDLSWYDKYSLKQFARQLKSHDLTALLARIEDEKKRRHVLAISEVQTVLYNGGLFKAQEGN